MFLFPFYDRTIQRAAEIRAATRSWLAPARRGSRRAGYSGWHCQAVAGGLVWRRDKPDSFVTIITNKLAIRKTPYMLSVFDSTRHALRQRRQDAGGCHQRHARRRCAL